MAADELIAGAVQNKEIWSQALGYLKDPILLVVAFTIISVGVILIYIAMSVMPITQFLYSNSRIQARSSRLVSDKKLRELAEAKSLQELSAQLNDTEYADELEKVDKNKMREFHLAIEKSFVNSVNELIQMSPDVSKPLLNSYLMFIEAKMLKAIYRVRYSNRELDESLVFPVGNITSILLKNLLQAETVADLNVVMENSIYWDVLSKEHKTLEEFEVALDVFVFNSFIDVIKKTKMYESGYIIDILSKKIDVLNLLALLKFRVRNIGRSDQKKFLVHTKSSLSARFDDLIRAESMRDFVESCKGLRYYGALAKALEKYEKDSSLSHFEHELLSFYKKSVVSEDLNHTLGPYPLFSYLVKKEIEQRNLFIISRGIDAKFSSEEIMGMAI